MTDTINIEHTINVAPTTGDTSSSCVSSYLATVRVAGWSRGKYTLTSDSPVNVDLNGLSEVHYLMVRCSAKVRMRATSADGNNQAIPVNPFAFIVSSGEPITAIDLTREAGVETSVEVFFAEEP